MATGLVYHQIETDTAVEYTIAGWAPVVASPNANIIPVSTQSFWLPAANGVLATAFATVQGSGSTNGLDGLTSGSAATSASGYSQTETLGAKEALVYYLSGDTTWTPSGAGANIAIWFLQSVDGGSTYESAQNTPSSSVPALSRPPDAVIPLDLVATGTAGVRKFATGRVKLPSGTFKVVAQNNGGATMGDTTTTHAAIYIAPVA